MGKPSGETSALTDREYWRGVLTAGGFTAIPRWTAHRGAQLPPAVADHDLAVPTELAAAAARLAEQLAVSPSAVLLAAHAKVLAALTGEGEVLTGYRAAAAASTLPCRLSAGDGSWQDVVVQCHRVETALAPHAGFPVAELVRELGVNTPLFETELDLSQTASTTELADGVMVRIAFPGNGNTLRLRYRTDVMDADYAARVAGYYLSALRMMTEDKGAQHQRQSLLSEQELELQVHGMAGRTKPLPDRRFHELFQDKVREQPDAVAARFRGEQWTYAELNSRANQIGNALLARGLRREDVVAVVTERNLDWMAAVIAIFKAGGAYLPIEPHFPAERIATTLTRSGTRIVLTESGSTATLEPALESAAVGHAVFLDAVYAEGHDDADLDIPVAADQLAYIYFTSGSTGQPKGAMCEQEGMLNHLYAKIDDLGVGPRTVLAQTAPQCFDISLWQLVAALLTGGTTLVIGQDVILDVRQFIEEIAAERVEVLQLVPSYLEVVLSHLEEEPRALESLHCVSTTGEALKKELTQRWFATFPGIKLANAYGLTETSDDTNHEVMDRVPDGERVPLGPPVSNVSIYVVDEQLSPVPLGSPGEIVFSGVCVGRGYINDEERTRQAFLADPHRPGQRMYRSGDFGRWLPDGKLEFFGRRDAQVKIRGFRIEIGEIENQLLRQPGVRDAAVVVDEGVDRPKRLVAFYSGPKLLPVAELRDFLGAVLPEYMVPAHFERLDPLPLTGNGKIDKKALTGLAGSLESAETAYQAPQTPSEQRLVAAWAEVLKTRPERIGRADHFFELGGNSVSALRLVIRLERAVSLKDVTRNPVLADLAAVIDGTGPGAEESTVDDTGYLQLLSAAEPTTVGALVCFPYAGGNAVNYQPLAKALAGNGIAVYGVELPGHDLSRDGEAFAGVEQITKAVAEEIGQRGLGPIVLWGHSSGAALAVEAAGLLQDQGSDVRRIFVGSQMVGVVADRLRKLAELAEHTDAEITAQLSTDAAYTELFGLDPQRAELVGAAYRHDCTTASQFFMDSWDEPPARRLSAPLSVVVAADDPSTAPARQQYRQWELFADEVELYELADGGHFFPNTRPDETAGIVLRSFDHPSRVHD